MSELIWTTEMELVLFQSMLDQVRIEKRADFRFDKEAWIVSLDQVNVVAKFPDLVTLKEAKDKLHTTNTKWNI